MQKEAGFATVVEDFQCVTNDQLPNIICFGVALLGAVLSIVVPSLGVLWLLLSIVAAVLYGFGDYGKARTFTSVQDRRKSERGG